MLTDYATLEEAFGVSSFLAPEPLIMRGGVGKISDDRHKTVMGSLVSASIPALEDQAPVPQRSPRELCRVQQAHAKGGAAAAWKAMPKHIREDMMWYAIRQFFEGDLMLFMLVGILMYILLR